MQHVREDALIRHPHYDVVPALRQELLYSASSLSPLRRRHRLLTEYRVALPRSTDRWCSGRGRQAVALLGNDGVGHALQLRINRVRGEVVPLVVVRHE